MQTQKVSGEAIRKLRYMKGLAQKDAGSRLEMSQQAYSKIEKNELIKPNLLQKIMRAFNYNENEFEKIIGYPPPEN
jgi:transcriptional regulator with XRE-family HTH domain